jgi:hypothetical protein
LEVFSAEMKEGKDFEMASTLREVEAGLGGRKKALKQCKSIMIPSFALPAMPSPACTIASSLQFTPSSPVTPVGSRIPWQNGESVVKKMAESAHEKRQDRQKRPLASS